MSRRGWAALAGTAVGVGAGVVAQRTAVARRRRNDPAAAEPFGDRRGERSHHVELPDGARLFVEETGPGNRRAGAVFVHGSALRTDMWHYQLDGVADHRLVFYDLRGHGRSQPKGDADYTIGTLATDLLAVIDDADLDEVVIVGHSVGGMVAMELCHDHPALVGTRIKGLVLCNTTPSPAYETTIGGAALARAERFLRHPLDRMGAYHGSIDRLRKIVRPTDQIFLAVSFAAFGPGASAKQIDFTYDMLAETPADVIFDLFRCYRDFDVEDHLERIDIPALVIAGSHDRLTVQHASERLAEGLPQARLEILQGCGHMSMLERPRIFNAMLASMLDEVLGAGTRRKVRKR